MSKYQIVSVSVNFGECGTPFIAIPITA